MDLSELTKKPEKIVQASGEPQPEIRTLIEPVRVVIFVGLLASIWLLYLSVALFVSV